MYELQLKTDETVIKLLSMSIGSSFPYHLTLTSVPWTTKFFKSFKLAFISHSLQQTISTTIHYSFSFTYKQSYLYFFFFLTVKQLEAWSWVCHSEGKKKKLKNKQKKNNNSYSSRKVDCKCWFGMEGLAPFQFRGQCAENE